MDDEVQQQTACGDDLQKGTEEGKPGGQDIPPIEGDQKRESELGHAPQKTQIVGLKRELATPKVEIASKSVCLVSSHYSAEEEEEDRARACDQVTLTRVEAMELMPYEVVREYVMERVTPHPAFCKRCAEKFETWNADFEFCGSCEDHYYEQ